MLWTPKAQHPGGDVHPGVYPAGPLDSVMIAIVAATGRRSRKDAGVPEHPSNPEQPQAPSNKSIAKT